MECPNHKGREMEPMFKEASRCPKCGGAKPPEQIGWVCKHDSEVFNLDGTKKE